MSSVSNSLIWALTKKNSKYAVLRKPQQFGGASLSSDPYNVMNVNSYRFTGVRDEAVSVTTSSTGKLTLRTKRTDKKGKIAQGIKKSMTKKKGFNNQGKWILKKLDGTGYRMDISRKALLRVARLNSAYFRHSKNTKKTKTDKVAVVEKK
jgi:large subunit ribosomal protein L28e